MSKQPECIKCGNYILHGNVVCQDCLPDHDADIIRKAREDFAKGLIELFKGFEDQHVLRYSPHEMVEYVETFEKLISLRSTTPQTEQEQEERAG